MSGSTQIWPDARQTCLLASHSSRGWQVARRPEVVPVKGGGQEQAKPAPWLTQIWLTQVSRLAGTAHASVKTHDATAMRAEFVPAEGGQRHSQLLPLTGLGSLQYCPAAVHTAALFASEHSSKKHVATPMSVLFPE